MLEATIKLLRDTNHLVGLLSASSSFREHLPEVLRTLSINLGSEKSFLLEIHPVKNVPNQLLFEKIMEVEVGGKLINHQVPLPFSETMFSEHLLKTWLINMATIADISCQKYHKAENNEFPQYICGTYKKSEAVAKVKNNKVCQSLISAFGISFSSFVIVPLVYDQRIKGFYITFSLEDQQWPELGIEMAVTLARLIANLLTNERLEQQKILEEIQLLKKNQNLYRKFIKHSSEGIYFMNCGKPIPVDLDIEEQTNRYYAHAYIEECNLSIAKMYGFKDKNDLLGQRIETLHQGEYYEQNRLSYHHFAENNYRVQNVQTKELGTDGVWRYFANEAFGIIEGGHLIGVWGTQRNITDQQNGTGDAFLEAVLHAIPDIKIRMNAKGQILALYNFTPEKIGLNFYSKNIKGKLLTEVLPIFIAKGLLFNAHKALQEKTLQSFEFLDTNEKNGGIRYYEARINNITKEEVIVILRDVTQLKIAEKALTEQISQVDQKNRELQKYIASNLQLENFAYVASHDLREPVRTMRTFGQFLKKRVGHQLDEESRTHLDFIINSANRMNQLIEDLLTYSRVNVESTTRDPIELMPLLTEITTSLKAAIEETNAVINHKSLPSTIYGNRVKIQQVFQNLLANGIKFHRAGVPPKITISAKETKTHWRFTVADNGIGIEEEFHDQIFVIFKKLHNHQVYQGTGIGLTLVKNVITQHGGEIWLDSKVGKGTSFYFTIQK